MAPIGFLLIVLGGLNIFAKELMWKLTDFQNRLEGQASERTSTWEVGTTLVGLLMVIIGFVMVASS